MTFCWLILKPKWELNIVLIIRKLLAEGKCYWRKHGSMGSNVFDLRNRLLFLRMRLFRKWGFYWGEPDNARSFHPQLRALYHANLIGIGQNKISCPPMKSLNTSSTDSCGRLGVLSCPLKICFSFEAWVYTSVLWAVFSSVLWAVFSVLGTCGCSPGLRARPTPL